MTLPNTFSRYCKQYLVKLYHLLVIHCSNVCLLCIRLYTDFIHIMCLLLALLLVKLTLKIKCNIFLFVEVNFSTSVFNIKYYKQIHLSIEKDHKNNEFVEKTF